VVRKYAAFNRRKLEDERADTQLAEIEAIAACVAETPPFADILICPPSTLITRAVQMAAGRIAIGGQDCRKEIAGAFTGGISAKC